MSAPTYVGNRRRFNWSQKQREEAIRWTQEGIDRKEKHNLKGMAKRLEEVAKGAEEGEISLDQEDMRRLVNRIKKGTFNVAEQQAGPKKAHRARGNRSVSDSLASEVTPPFINQGFHGVAPWPAALETARGTEQQSAGPQKAYWDQGNQPVSDSQWEQVSGSDYFKHKYSDKWLYHQRGSSSSPWKDAVRPAWYRDEAKSLARRLGDNSTRLRARANVLASFDPFTPQDRRRQCYLD
ncbi:hypothetical protein T439DRAFT_380917 [Meredithblackwellia eburnea MCA 4105]